MMIERYGPKGEMKLFGHIKHTSAYFSRKSRNSTAEETEKYKNLERRKFDIYRKTYRNKEGN